MSEEKDVEPRERHPPMTKPRRGAPFPSGGTRRIGPPGAAPVRGQNVERAQELPDEQPEKDRD